MSKATLVSDAAAEPRRVTKQGWLDKQGGSVRSWKKRWFALHPLALEYFRDQSLKEILGKIPIQDCTVNKETPQGEGPGSYIVVRLPPGKAKRTDFWIRAPNDEERDSWIDSIHKLLIVTIFGHDPKVNAGNFATACMTNPHKPGVYLPVPYFFVKGVSYLERNGLDVQGIYRENGAQSRIEGFETAVDGGADFDFSDPHTAAGLLKRFVRRAPDPILTYQNLPALKALFARGSDLDTAALKRFQRIIAGLPLPNYLVLAYWFKHLLVVRSHDKQNLMGSQPLSVCIGPSMIWTETDDAGVSDATLQASIVLALLEHYDDVFGSNPLLHYGASGKQGFARLRTEQDTNGMYALKAPEGAIVQTLAADKYGWNVCVWNQNWGAVHSRFLEPITDPKEIAKGLSGQDEKWTLTPEETQQMSVCQEAVDLYRTLSDKLKDLRARAK
jgi:hypothetical protein